MTSNLVLQHRDVNRGVWGQLEMLSRAYICTPARWRVDDEWSTTAEEKRRLFLQALMAQQTPLVSRTRRARAAAVRSPSRRRLAVCCGPLYAALPTSASPTTADTLLSSRWRHSRLWRWMPSRLSPPHPSAPAAEEEHHPTVSSSKHGHHKQHHHGRRHRPTSSSSSDRAPHAAAFFMVMWDYATDQHVAFIVPNRRAATRVAAADSAGVEGAWTSVLPHVVPLVEVERALEVSMAALEQRGGGGRSGTSRNRPRTLWKRWQWLMPGGGRRGRGAVVLFPRLQRRYRRRERWARWASLGRSDGRGSLAGPRDS